MSLLRVRLQRIHTGSRLARLDLPEAHGPVGSTGRSTTRRRESSTATPTGRQKGRSEEPVLHDSRGLQPFAVATEEAPACDAGTMPIIMIEISGTDLPGRTCDPDPGGRPFENIHVGLARGSETV